MKLLFLLGVVLLISTELCFGAKELKKDYNPYGTNNGYYDNGYSNLYTTPRPTYMTPNGYGSNVNKYTPSYTTQRPSYVPAYAPPMYNAHGPQPIPPPVQMPLVNAHGPQPIQQPYPMPYQMPSGPHPVQQPSYGVPNYMPTYTPTYPTQRPYLRPTNKPTYYTTPRSAAMTQQQYYPSNDLKNMPALSYLLAGPSGYYVCHNHGQPITPFAYPVGYTGQPLGTNSPHKSYSSYPVFSQMGYPSDYVFNVPSQYQAGYGQSSTMQNHSTPEPYVIGPHGQPCTFVFYPYKY